MIQCLKRSSLVGMKVITCSPSSPIFYYSSSDGGASGRYSSEALGVPLALGSLTKAGTAGDGLLPCMRLVVRREQLQIEASKIHSVQEDGKEIHGMMVASL